MIKLHNIKKTYRRPDGESLHALDGVSLHIARGEFVAITGPSGSGKSTLMNILGSLDNPTSGTYLFDETDIARLDVAAQAHFRNRHLGFVFQAFHLLPRTSALDNVGLPLLYSNTEPRPAAALQALEAVGLGDRARHTPAELSGGQQQRVAIARALVNEPELLLADEPTGNLDAKAANEILALFEKLNTGGRTIVLVTHDPGIALRAKRIIRVEAGQITSDEMRRPSAAAQETKP